MKKKILVLATAVCLLAIAAGGTMAYFSKESEPIQNVITTGNVDIELYEWADDAHTVPFRNITGAMPGDSWPKIVEVKNTGENTAYVRLSLKKTITSSSPETTLDPDKVILDINEKDWTLKDGYYYYNKALEPGETTTPLFHQVSFDVKMDNEYKGALTRIEVTAFAVQKANNGEDPLTAKGWPAVPEM